MYVVPFAPRNCKISYKMMCFMVTEKVNCKKILNKGLYSGLAHAAGRWYYSDLVLV